LFAASRLAMLEINQRLTISVSAFGWRFARSGGPGGQNVNKVASKATLLWDVANSSEVPADVKQRLAALYPSYFTKEGVLQITSQRHRDQERNREDCLEKLRSMLSHACHVPRVRKKTKPTRGSKLARLQGKKHRAAIKSSRRITED
jgi:ribosome-associated protein